MKPEEPGQPAYVQMNGEDDREGGRKEEEIPARPESRPAEDVAERGPVNQGRDHDDDGEDAAARDLRGEGVRGLRYEEGGAHAPQQRQVEQDHGPDAAQTGFDAPDLLDPCLDEGRAILPSIAPPMSAGRTEGSAGLHRTRAGDAGLGR